MSDIVTIASGHNKMCVVITVKFIFGKNCLLWKILFILIHENMIFINLFVKKKMTLKSNKKCLNFTINFAIT